MIDTIALRTELTSRLAVVHPRVWYEQAPPGSTKPYLTFTIENMDNKPSEDYLLDVDIWDKSSNTTAIETLADAVDQAFNGLSFSTEDLNATIYKNSRFSVEDDDETLIRRRITFDMRVYYK